MPALRAEVRQVSKKMGRAQALWQVEDVFGAGQVHGIIGPNGAGKTTLIRVLAGLLHPNEGSVVYDEAGKLLSAARPLSPLIPVGISSAILFAELLLAVCTARAAGPGSWPWNPVPKIPSRIRQLL